MAMETNAAALQTTIQPVRRTGTTGNVSSVARQDSTSPFSPQTNVNIRNSIADMAGILAKISTNQDTAVEEMPQQIQKLIQNVLQNAFSLDSTLAEGLGSTMESQRFSTEQLNILSRMLSQLGTLVEKGATEDMSDALQSFLQNLKSFVTENEKGLEPVLLNKWAFQLLNTKDLSTLPEMLQKFLAASAESSAESPAAQQTTAGTPAKADSASTASSLLQKSAAAEPPVVQNVKQLLQQLMPSPAPSEGAVPGESPAAQQMGKSAGEQAAASLPSKGTASEGMAGKQTTEAPGNPAGEAQTRMQTVKGEAVLTTAAEGKQQNPSAQSSAAEAKTNASASSVMPELAADAVPTETLSGSQETAAAQNAESTKTGQPTALPQTEQPAAGESSAKTAQPTAVPLPLENTEETLQTMKSLADLLLQDASLTEQDTALLQQFVNDEQPVLTEKDAKQLQLLLRLCQNNVPAAVQQAANRQDMPDLSKMWAFMQLCDVSGFKGLKSKELKNAGKNIAAFASAMKQTMGGDSSTVQSQRSMNFMMPLYLGENERSYPAYIHVYNEEHASENGGTPEKETWLRLCVLTENIGAVELVCRVYEKQNLNVRVFFSDSAAEKAFTEYVPEFKASFEHSSLVLTDLKIGAAGNKKS